MKKHLLLFTLILFMGFSQVGWGQNGIFFSEYFEGTSNNKAIEIYNGITTGTTINLNRIRIRVYANGAVAPTTTTALSTAEDGSTTTIAWNTTFVIYNPLFATISTNIPNAPTSRRVAITNPTNYNGDDAVELQYDTDGLGTWVTVDVFGQIGFDPGTFWGTSNTTTLDNGIIRKSTINTGRTSAAFTPSDEFTGRSASADATLPVTTLGGHTCDIPLPVELTSFSALTKNKTVNLTWHTAIEVNNYGFEIQKSNVKTQNSDVEAQWSKVGFVNGSGNSNSAKQYNFTDRSVSTGKYIYRLKQLDNDGQYEYSKEIEVDLGMPTEFALEQNYPNPFNPSTSIQYSVVSSQNVVLKIFNVIGKEVAVLVNEKKEPGTYTVDFSAANLASGTYLYRLQTGELVQTKKMILLK